MVELPTEQWYPAERWASAEQWAAAELAGCAVAELAGVGVAAIVAAQLRADLDPGGIGAALLELATAKLTGNADAEQWDAAELAGAVRAGWAGAYGVGVELALAALQAEAAADRAMLDAAVAVALAVRYSRAWRCDPRAADQPTSRVRGCPRSSGAEPPPLVAAGTSPLRPTGPPVSPLVRPRQAAPEPAALRPERWAVSRAA